MMDTNTMTNEELNNLANEMLPKVSSLADLVSYAFPEKNAGPAIKECVDILQSCMSTLTERADQVNKVVDFNIEDLPIATPAADQEALKALALKDCIATFKVLDTLRTQTKENLDDLHLRTIEVLGTHARELFSTLTNKGV